MDVYELRAEIEERQPTGLEFDHQLILSDVAKHLGVSPAVAGEAAEMEILSEMADVYMCRAAAQFLESLPPEAEIAFVSDFYMSATALRRILKAASVDSPKFQIITSAEAGMTKRRGQLLAHVRSSKGVSETSRHLHVGDSQEADCDPQIRDGGRFLRADFIRADSGRLGRLEAWKLLDQQITRNLEASRPPIQEVSDNDVRGLEIARHAGHFASPLAVLLVIAAQEEASRRAASKVRYLSREGLFLARVHEEIAQHWDMSMVNAERWPISRIAAAAAGLQHTSPENFAKSTAAIFAQYPRQTLKSILNSCGYEIEIDVDTSISDPQDLSRVIQERGLWPGLREHLETSRLRARLLLDGKPDTETIVTCDVGWRGTIQDYLTSALGSREVFGVYLGLYPSYGKQSNSGSRVGVAFDARTDSTSPWLALPAAIESPWSIPISAVNSWGWSQEDIESWSPAETEVNALIEAYQTGLIQAAKHVVHALTKFPLTWRDYQPLLRRRLVDYMNVPHPGVADIWFRAQHDETYGANGITPFQKPKPGGFRSQEEIRSIAATTNWPQGFLAWNPVAKNLAELL